MRQKCYLAVGLLCVFLGICGIFLPLLPTTPFLLAAAFLFAKSSPRFYAWLTGNEYLNSFLLSYQKGIGVPVTVIRRSLLFLWVTLLVSGLLWDNWYYRLLLLAVGLAVSAHLLSLRKSKRKELQFTLVELLISLGIIAVLASMLLPALNKAKTLARNSQCMNQLRQIGTVIAFYANDQNGFLPYIAAGYPASSIHVLRVPGAGVMGLGRLIAPYHIAPETFGCNLNPSLSAPAIRTAWAGAMSTVTSGYLYRADDAGMQKKYFHPANRGKAVAMDFCCITPGSYLIAHDFRDVNILYSDNSVVNRANSPTPDDRFTTQVNSHSLMSIPDCTRVWANADAVR